MEGVLPSFFTDYARNQGESRYPEYWLNLRGLWAPYLGATGDTLFDVSGYGNHGALQADTHFVPGKDGLALDFDGTGDYVVVTRATIFEPAAAVTVVLRVKISEALANFEYMMAKPRTAGSPSYGMLHGTTTYTFTINDGAQTDSPGIADALVEDGIWHQMAGTYDGVTVRLYFDGVEVGTGTANTGNLAYNFGGIRDLHFGSFEGANLMTGELACIMIYGRAMTAAEIAFLHAHPTAPLELADTLIVKAPAVVGAVPKGPLGHPLYGALAGPI